MTMLQTMLISFVLSILTIGIFRVTFGLVYEPERFALRKVLGSQSTMILYEPMVWGQIMFNVVSMIKFRSAIGVVIFMILSLIVALLGMIIFLIPTRMNQIGKLERAG